MERPSLCPRLCLCPSRPRSRGFNRRRSASSLLTPCSPAVAGIIAVLCQALGVVALPVMDFGSRLSTFDVRFALRLQFDINSH